MIRTAAKHQATKNEAHTLTPKAALAQPKARPGARAAICILLSMAMLVPCFWHSRIQAGDLASHMYNAWLASLVSQGKAPGLILVPQSTNVLFDSLAVPLGTALGFAVAEKIVVSAFVLLFFWGAMYLCARAAGRIPSRIVPVLALAAYGWTFQMGFMNYYASLACSFWGLAFWWKGGKWRYAMFLAAAVAWVAQPTGLVLLAAGVGLSELFSRVNRSWHIIIAAGLAGGVFGVRFWIVQSYRIVPARIPWYARTGANQLVLYDDWYAVLGYLFVLSLAAAVGLAYVRGGGEGIEQRKLQLRPVLLTLMAVVAIVCWTIPDGFFVPQYPGPLNFMASRMTVLLLVLTACYVSTCKIERWQAVAWVLMATCYFGLLYRDTTALNEMEDQAAQLVRQRPAGSRVIAVLEWPGSMVFTHHLVDRACIGHCFSFANYEPPSGQFRLRTTGPSPLVIDHPAASTTVQRGRLIVRAKDLPLYVLYQCGSKTKLCIHELQEGEANGQIVREQGWLAQQHQP